MGVSGCSIHFVRINLLFCVMRKRYQQPACSMSSSRPPPNNVLEQVRWAPDIATRGAALSIGVVVFATIRERTVGFMRSNDNDSYSHCKDFGRDSHIRDT